MANPSHVGKFVCIGGGDMQGGETEPIDREIIRATGKDQPLAVFIPTASFDDRDYTQGFTRFYGNLGCRVEPLFLWQGYQREEIETIIQETKWNESPHDWEFRGDRSRMEALIGEADLIYVGGGNTKRMIEFWRSAGVDVALKQARDRGCVLSGLSAGCICWAEFGNSDFALTEGLGRNTARTECLGFVPFTLCPHTMREPFRLEEFGAMMQEQDGIGVGIDDGCALQIDGGRFRVLTSIPDAKAHVLVSKNHEIVAYRPLPPQSDWSELDSIG